MKCFAVIPTRLRMKIFGLIVSALLTKGALALPALRRTTSLLRALPHLFCFVSLEKGPGCLDAQAPRARPRMSGAENSIALLILIQGFCWR